MSNFKLRNWQKAVVEFVDAHDEMYNSESMTSVSQYARNRDCSIRVCFPRQSGHTTLAAYLATVNSAVLVYSDLNHYKTLRHFARDVEGDSGLFDETVDCLSVFHIYHDILVQSRSNVQSEALNNLKMKFSLRDNRMVVIDEATNIFEAHPEILDWIYNIANGPIVILG